MILYADINILHGSEEELHPAITEWASQHNITVVSRYAAKKDMQDARVIMLALGGGISAILGLIGIFNFANVISVGIMARKRELAMLESIGMEKRRLRHMLLLEGLWYAAITLLLTATAGSVVVSGVYALFKVWVGYAVFTYPVVPVLTAFALIAVVCTIVPLAAYQSMGKATLVERLRGTD